MLAYELDVGGLHDDVAGDEHNDPDTTLGDGWQNDQPDAAAAITEAPQGSTVHDKAVVTGGADHADGNGDFTVYTTETDCTGPSQAAGTASHSWTGRPSVG